jgi:hypothetical protein
MSMRVGANIEQLLCACSWILKSDVHQVLALVLIIAFAL